MPEDKKKQEDRLGELFIKVMKEQLNGDKEHGWGVNDSMAVIEQIIAEDAPNGYSPSERCLELIRDVVNPSAFRQKLESAKLLNESKKNEKRTSSLKGLLAQFGE